MTAALRQKRHLGSARPGSAWLGSATWSRSDPVSSRQMLHNKHVMVRVGGGWETFESYLLKHDPCRMLQFSRAEGKTSPVNSGGKSAGVGELSPDSYLVVAAHYRSKK